MSSNVESMIVNSLLYNEGYVRRVLPHLKDEYFEELNNKIVFDEINKYFTKYDAIPTKEALSIELETRSDLTGDTYTTIVDWLGHSQDLSLIHI